MLLKIHPDIPSVKKIRQVADILMDNGLIIYPTDTVYALACALDQKKAYERLCKVKGIAPQKAQFSLVFRNLSQASEYLLQLETPVYRMLRRNLPGPFTFILPTGNKFPSFVRKGRKTAGLRIPNHMVTYELLNALDVPLLTSSLKKDDNIQEYYTDPNEIYEKYQHVVDLVIDSGSGTFEPSTVVDLTSGNPEIIRQGKGELKL